VISRIIGKIKQAQQEAAVHAVAYPPSNDANIEFSSIQAGKAVKSYAHL